VFVPRLRDTWRAKCRLIAHTQYSRARAKSQSHYLRSQVPTLALEAKAQKENEFRKTRETVSSEGQPFFKPQINPPLKGMPVRKKKSRGPPACSIVKSKPNVRVEVYSLPRA